MQALAMASLLVMAAIWGSTFFLIKDVVTRVPVTDMLVVRFALATAAVALVLGLRRQLVLTRDVVVPGTLLGLVFGAAQVLQTYGLERTSASISGFVTGLYVVITPLLTWVLLRHRVGTLTWVAVLLATLGLGVLSLDGFTVSPGALLTLASAVCYALHIVGLGRWSDPRTALSMTAVQLAVVTLVCLPPALLDGVQLPATAPDWGRVLYLALVAGALTMLLQTWAQSQVPATRAAVVMSMEPVFGALFAVALGGEVFTWRITVGGLSILAAMYLVELSPLLRRPRRGDPPVRHPEESGAGDRGGSWTLRS
ncbi:EamA family transporter [Auraticoccus sp. F435]|uniref:EamA family transporter n=2 Tax=Auraticoccus cholistanensis TaxID=2656650 RepID=A0A6A9V1F6_9ACTN|nr:EamA family transporter [Auraticoccus cholistanensis]